MAGNLRVESNVAISETRPMMFGERPRHVPVARPAGVNLEEACPNR